MYIDRERARETLLRYVGAYDIANPRIALKLEHTFKVAELCERIARSEGLPARDVDLAWLCGLVHDIGRFEQVRRWGTFRDADSASHAQLGVEVLFGGLAQDAGARAVLGDARCEGAGVIGCFAEGREEDGLIRTAVAEHSAFRVSAGLDARTQMFCDIVRDADKVDILRAACTCDRAAIFGVDGATLRESGVSPAVAAAFYGHRTVRREERSQPADLPLSFACFVFELVFDEAARAAREQGYALELLEMPFERTETREQVAAMRAHLEGWLEQRLA